MLSDPRAPHASDTAGVSDESATGNLIDIQLQPNRSTQFFLENQGAAVLPQTYPTGEASTPMSTEKLQTRYEPSTSPEPQNSSRTPHWRNPLLGARKQNSEPSRLRWTPPPLQTWFWVSLVLFMFFGAVGLEIALAVCKKRKGWAARKSAESGFQHYLITFPPVAVAMVLVALWAWTDIEIKKMQPYVDLTRGQSPAHRSLLLDYTRTNNFIVWTRAAANKHFLVVLTTIVALFTLTFQPLAAALVSVRNVWFTLPDTTVQNLALIGLNQNSEFSDLTSFLTAAGYASASVLYGIDNPSFINQDYTIGPILLPLHLATNGTVVANTTAIKTEPGCVPADSPPTMTKIDGGWSNTATQGLCSITWTVDNSTTNLFGATVPNCTTPNYGTIPPQFRPAVFWFFTYQPTVAASATFCSPSISLWDVTARVDLATGNLTHVTVIRPFDASSSNFSSASGNITGTPLNGRAYNGVEFPFAQNNSFVLAREAAIKLQLPAAVFQSSSQGQTAVFDTNGFAELSSNVYSTYLRLIAKSVYFLPASEPIQVKVLTFKLRFWLNDFAVHFLASILFLLAFLCTFIQLWHRRERENLHLAHQPGTIASAVSIGAQTHVADILDGTQKESEFATALRNKKFRIDSDTMKIVLEGEDGYEDAASPDPRRSIFGFLQVPAMSFLKT